MRAICATSYAPVPGCLVVAVLGGCGSRTPLRIEAREDSGSSAGLQVQTGGSCVTDADCGPASYCVTSARCDPARGCVLTARDCDDGIACTRDACDAAMKRCTHSPDDTRCDDSQLCSVKRGCDAFVYAVASDAHLYEARIPSGELVDLGASAMSPGDVALGADGTLYATDSYVLYRVDRANAGALAVASILPLHLYNGLGAAHDGTLQATADVAQVFTIAPADGSASPLGPLLPGYRASGDVTMLGPRILVAVFASARPSSDALVQVDATSLTARVIGDIGFRCVWGLATLGVAVYGLTCEGRVLLIDATSGVGTELSRAVPAFVGAAAR